MRVPSAEESLRMIIRFSIAQLAVDANKSGGLGPPLCVVQCAFDQVWQKPFVRAATVTAPIGDTLTFVTET
jgi:hypothetical protein